MTAKRSGKVAPSKSPKHDRFVAEYLVDLNATQAAIRAGYSRKTAGQQGERLLRNAEISAAVEVALAKRSEKVGVTAEYVVENLREVVERCMQRAPVTGPFGVQVTDDEGRAVWKFDAKGAVGALGLLGKHLGMFVDKVDHTSAGQPLKFSFALDNANGAGREDA